MKTLKQAILALTILIVGCQQAEVLRAADSGVTVNPDARVWCCGIEHSAWPKIGNAHACEVRIVCEVTADCPQGADCLGGLCRM